MHFDLLIITPLEEEFREVLQGFDMKSNLTEGTRVKYHLEGPNGSQILAVLQEEMGYWAAGAACASALDEHSIGLVICLGIAGVGSRKGRTLRRDLKCRCNNSGSLDGTPVANGQSRGRGQTQLGSRKAAKTQRDSGARSAIAFAIRGSTRQRQKVFGLRPGKASRLCVLA
jgi:hypothetical protein